MQWFYIHTCKHSHAQCEWVSVLFSLSILVLIFHPRRVPKAVDIKTVKVFTIILNNFILMFRRMASKDEQNGSVGSYESRWFVRHAGSNLYTACNLHLHPKWKRNIGRGLWSYDHLILNIATKCLSKNGKEKELLGMKTESVVIPIMYGATLASWLEVWKHFSLVVVVFCRYRYS